MGCSTSKAVDPIPDYIITIHTNFGDLSGANFFLILKGTEIGREVKVPLQDSHRRVVVQSGKKEEDHKKKRDIVETYHYQGPNVGELLFIILDMEPGHLGSPAWRPGKVVIESNHTKKKYYFAVYRWLKGPQRRIEIREASISTIGSKTALSKLHPGDLKQRKQAIQQCRLLYRWDPETVEKEDKCWVCEYKLPETVFTCDVCGHPQYCSLEHQKIDHPYHIPKMCPTDKKSRLHLHALLPLGFAMAKGDCENNLPTDEELDPEKYESRDEARFLARKDALFASFESKLKGWDFTDLHHYDSLFSKLIPKPTRADKWNDDREFAYLRVAGLNPLLIRRLEQIPEKFPVTSELVNQFLDSDTNLDQELLAGHVYWIDYRHLATLKHTYDTLDSEMTVKGATQNPAPMVLFYVSTKNNGILLPIAIQLYQTPDPLWNPIYFPSDGPAWHLAKIYCNVADGVYHQCSAHLLQSHLLAEVVVLAMNRNLSESHPVYKLLKTHCKNTLAINQSGVSILLKPDGVIDRVANVRREGCVTMLQLIAKDWKVSDNNPLLDLKARGVDDNTLLPFYPYRDDVKALWIANRSFISNILNYYYDAKDDPLAADEELKNFVYEIRHYGFQRHPEGFHLHEEKKTSLEDLIELVTLFIHTCSVHHAASNGPQFAQYGFPPYYPLGARTPPPNFIKHQSTTTTTESKLGLPISKKDITQEMVLAALPGMRASIPATAVSFVLSSKPENEEKLGEFREQLFFEKPILEYQLLYQKQLEEINASIEGREKLNKEKDLYPYPWLTPKNVAPSVSS